MISKRAATVQQLLRLKQESDRRNYTAKHRMATELIRETPDDFLIDSEERDVVGITHQPSGFRFHLPKEVAGPLFYKTAADPTYSLADFYADEAEKDAKGRPMDVTYLDPKKIPTYVGFRTDDKRLHPLVKQHGFDVGEYQKEGFKGSPALTKALFDHYQKNVVDPYVKKTYPRWSMIPPNYRRSIRSLVTNVGPGSVAEGTGASGFKKFNNAINAYTATGDFKNLHKAIVEFNDSRRAKQLPNRVRRETNDMKKDYVPIAKTSVQKEGSDQEWIGVDLDGTLAKYNGWKGPDVIGAPISKMVDRVKRAIGRGKNVKIFTARVAGDNDGVARRAVKKWCRENLGMELPVTCVKDQHCREIWDDIAKKVYKNTGSFNKRAGVISKIACGDMLAYFRDNPKKYEEWKERQKAKKKTKQQKEAKLVIKGTPVQPKSKEQAEAGNLGASDRISKVSKSIGDSVLTDSEFGGDLSNAHAGVSKGPEPVKVDENSMKLAHMLGFKNNLEVFQPIVETVPVSMVDRLIGSKRASEMLLHDPSVLSHRSSIDCNVPVFKTIVRGTDLVSPLRSCAAGMTTKEACLPLSGGLRSKRNTTGSAGLQGFFEAYLTAEGVGRISDFPSGSLKNASASTAGKRRKVSGRHVTGSVCGRKVTVNVDPTEAQARAGTYKKGHTRLHGMDITIENLKGQYRKGTSPDGTEWKTLMKHHYGYVKRTKSQADGDHVDVFIGPEVDSEMVFVVNQTNEGGKGFDEHKCMLGFTNEKDARKGYLDNYEKGWDGLGSITALTIDQFKKWVKNGDTSKALEPLQKVGSLDKRAGVLSALFQGLKERASSPYDKSTRDYAMSVRPEKYEGLDMPEEFKTDLKGRLENIKKVVNGVGSPATWYYKLNPDTLYGMDLTPASDIHDYEYARPGRKFKTEEEQEEYRAAADDRFEQNLMKMIAMHSTPDSVRHGIDDKRREGVENFMKLLRWGSPRTFRKLHPLEKAAGDKSEYAYSELEVPMNMDRRAAVAHTLLKIANGMENVKELPRLGRRELTRAVRDAIIEEQKAIKHYETVADSTENRRASKILQDIADEEKVHVGELEALLEELDPTDEDFREEGEEEVEEMEGAPQEAEEPEIEGEEKEASEQSWLVQRVLTMMGRL